MSYRNSPPRSPSPSAEDLPPILSVVIGVNEYTTNEYEDLYGAVSDADLFEQFLRENLKVPSENIRSLRDTAATRDGIISAFTSLRDDRTYKRDEAAIIIYYAGHGAHAPVPAEWTDWKTANGHVEMLCPSDIGLEKGPQQEEVQGIPDRTISSLLNSISETQGNNITAIFDCCCSAGLSRGQKDDAMRGYIIRQISNPPPITADCDLELWSEHERGTSVSEGFSGKFNASHILLAACGREQLACEDQKTRRGLFTTSLLQVLRSDLFPTLTYSSLMHRMKLLHTKCNQTPHCEGQGIERRLFNSKGAGADGSYILVRYTDNKLVLEAGDVQGVMVGSRFSVHASNLIGTPTFPNPCLGYLSVFAVDAFSSTLNPDADAEPAKPPSPLFYCKLYQHPTTRSISLFSTDRHWLEYIFPADKRALMSVILVDDMHTCDLELSVLGDKVYFDRHRHSEIVNLHLGPRLTQNVDVSDVEAIHKVVASSINFYHHLTRTGPNDLKWDISMELRQMRQISCTGFEPGYVPIGENLIAQHPATLEVSKFPYLGMTISNETNVSLYPYLFYFDPNDLSITTWYTSPIGAGADRVSTIVDAPLPPRKSFTIGCGASGAQPWCFWLREGDKKDVGFLKLFLSVRPAYFYSICQQSPFEESGMRSEGIEESAVGEEKLSDDIEWATKSVTIIQV